MLGSRFFLVCLVVLSFPLHGETSSPNPRGFYEKQPDGSFTPRIFLRGSEHEHYLMDDEGYIVTRDENEWFVYATMKENGDLGSTGIPVGHKGNDGRKLRREEIQETRGRDAMNTPLKKPLTFNKPKSSFRRNLAVTARGNVNNLVLLARFSDHKNRTLPSSSAYSLLFNAVGGDKTIAPTGSIKDYYLSNSYGLLTITSFINDWILVPFTEASAAQSSTPIVLYILNYLANAGFSFNKLGGVSGQKVDFVTLLHSGYGAEWGETDCYGVDMSKRVWSHEQSLSWKSPDGILISAYTFTTGLWDVCGNVIARIGMIAHETGHVLGLPDLYDPNAVGVGSYDVMSDCWGFDGSQYYPPMFSPWSKIQLGWIVPAKLSMNGNYTISQSANTTLIYRLDTGFPVGEYLLLENRQNIGYDRMLAQGGLAIWHIDENADRFHPGYPGQSSWPVNGNHYQIALLQADGQYELEHGNENWGKGDLYRADFVWELGPSWRPAFGPFPNTDTYQGGVVNNTGIRIFNIGSSSSRMNFSLSFGNKAPLGLLSTMYTNDTSSDGNMFSIRAKTAIIVKGMAINLDSSSRCPVEVWIKTGTYIGYQQSSASWNKIASTVVESVGLNSPTPLPNGSFAPISLAASNLLSFYVTVSSQCGTLRYGIGTKEGNVAASNQDLSILEGTGNYYPFRNSLTPRVWSGSLLYVTQDSSNVSTKPTMRPTRGPTKKPTAKPGTNIKPSIAPSAPSIIRLATTFSGGSGLSGCMFSIQAKLALTIQTIDIHLPNVTGVPIEVWIMQGSYVGLENKKSAWTNILQTKVSGAGMHRVTRLVDTFTPLKVKASQIISFYVTAATTQTPLINSPGYQVNKPYSVNNDLIIMEGAEVSYPFGQYIAPKVWNGAIRYVVG